MLWYFVIAGVLGLYLSWSVFKALIDSSNGFLD